jgi:YbgC/YbaW family acyl-CoA thioester hydrolase
MKFVASSAERAPMNRTHFRFFDPLRVRWAEVDMQQIVFNGHYLMYFDTAVAGYWRALAVPYQQAMQQLQGDLYVRKATLEYLASARYDERLDVGVRCLRIGTSSLLLAAAVFRGERCLVHGELVYVFADPHSQTSKPVPDALRTLMLGFEAGEPMLDVRVAGWAEHAVAVQGVRDAVLADDAGVPVALEQDAAALHAVAYNRLQQAVGCGRLVMLGDGVAELAGVASLPGLRGAGVGRSVVQALAAAAAQQGAQRLRLHAPKTSLGFWQRLGFVGSPSAEDSTLVLLHRQL